MKHLLPCFLFVFVFPLASLAKEGAPISDFCINQPSSQRKIIFFSGILSSKDDSTWKNYEEVLRKVAHENKISFFMPQNLRPCANYKNSYCWPRHDQSISIKLIKDLMEMAKSCFNQTGELEFHGHSNGAYFLYDAIQDCHFPNIKTAVFIGGGSRSTRNGSKKEKPICKQNLYFAAGEKDKIFPKLKHLAEELGKELMGSTKFIKLPGGHDLRSDQYKLILEASEPRH